MIQIYFDDNLINEDYYTSLSTNFSLFNDTFFLGSTAANAYELSIAKEAIGNHPSIVTIKDEGVSIATLVVDKIEENDFEYIYTLMDKMVDLEFKYDASEIFTNGSATLLEIAQDICNKAGIELATMDFRGYNKGITWYDNTRTARDYIGYIAELNGGYAQIGKDGRLYFIKQNTPSAKTISIEDCSDFKIGEKHRITRVIYEQGALKYEYGDESGNTLYLNGDNVYITDQTEVEEIYNEIKGFEFYSFNTSNCPIDYNIMAGQVITFVDGENSYPTIVGYDDLTFNGHWYGGYNLNVATKKQEETQVIGTSEKIRDLSIKVDRETNKIAQAIKEIDDQNNKISQVTQTVDELNSKIGDIADITTSQETLNGTISFEGINQSEPIYVKIYPTGVNISYLYPRENLFPSETLFMTVRTLRFTNTTTNEYIDYELPTDLLYYDSENYDEFILDYDAQTCVVNKRVGYNADGTTHILENPSTIEYEYPRINLTDGDYTVELLGYRNAYMLVRLMAQNIYTTQFATKAEMNSEIKQTVEEVNIGVDKKLESYPTTTQMNAAINVKSEEINSEVSKKVNESEFATLVKQNAEAIQYAWNQISQYIQLEAIDGKASLVIYDRNNNKLLVLDLSGQRFYNGDTLIGTMGISQRNNELGVTMNLQEGSFMGWGIYDSNTDSYKDALSLDKEALRLGTSLKTRGHRIYLNSGEDAYTVPFVEGMGLATKKPFIITDENYNSIANFGTDYIRFYKPISLQNLDVYDANLVGSKEIYYMETASEGQYLCVDSTEHGRIAVVTTMSDGRLKENIVESQVSALEVIEKIKHRQYDWKKSKKHEKLGYIAQELEEIDKDLVIKVPQTDQEGNVIDELYQYNTNTIVKYLTKATQELSEELKEQKKINEFLLEKLNLQEEYKKQNKTSAKKKDNIKQYTKEEIKRKTSRKILEQQETIEQLQKEIKEMKGEKKNEEY